MPTPAAPASATVSVVIPVRNDGPHLWSCLRALAAQTLADIGPVRGRRARAKAERAAVQATASVLGNTAAVARSSYIDPRVFALYRWRHPTTLLGLTLRYIDPITRRPDYGHGPPPPSGPDDGWVDNVLVGIGL